MAVLVDSRLLLPSYLITVQCRKPLMAPASQPADREPHLLPRHSSRLLTVKQHSSFPAPTTTRLLRYYARLASNLSLSGRFHEFLTIVEDVLASEVITSAEKAYFIAKIEGNMVSEGIATVIGDGKLMDVLDFLTRAEKFGINPLSLLYGPAIKALQIESSRLIHQGRLDQFVRLMEILAGYGLFIKDVADPSNTIKFFVEKRKPEMAVRYARLFPEFQILVCSIIQEFGKKKDKFSATRTYEAFNEKSEDMYFCRNLIDACGLCGDFLKSRQIFEGLLAKNLTPNVFFLNSLMNVNSHDLNYTLNVFSHMQMLGVTADMTSYNILMKACNKAKRVDLAQKIYEEAKQEALNGTFKLDIITYSTMMKVFADAKMPEMAFKVKDEMLIAGLHPNVVTWSILISICANATFTEKAVMIFEEMLISGCEPNSHCYNSLLHACVESYQYDRAFRFVSSWKATGFEVVNLDQGSKHVVPFKPTVVTFNILMKACGTDHFRANALIKEMKMLGLFPNHISWSILIGIYGNSNDMKGAIQALRAMRDTGIKLDVIAYTVAIKACVQSGHPRIAFYLFEEMKIYQLKPNLVTYRTLLSARSQYGSLGEVQQRLAVYQDMRKEGYSSNDYYLKELLEEWCEGVIYSNSRKKKLHGIDKRFHVNGPKKPTCLLEKVSTFLQKDVDEYKVIDIRGLSKVEGRIVILSFLRMIKENYQEGKVIEDDVTIILGDGEETIVSTGDEHGVREAILHVLRDELGLHVVTGHEPDQSISAVIKKPSLATETFLARRPRDSGFFKVSKESIYQWLQRKEVTKFWFNQTFTFLGRHRSAV